MTTLRERYAAAKQAAHDIHDAVKAEDRPFTDSERAEFDKLVAEATGLRSQIDQIDADRDALAGLDELVEPATASTKKASGSIGEQFVASDGYKAMLAAQGGKISDTAQRISMDKVQIKDFQAALVTDPGFTAPTHRVAPESMEIIDLLQAITLIENAPEVIKTFTGTFVSAAADVAEGDAKPEASLSWTTTTLTMGTKAHWLPVTNQALGHNPTLRTRIDGHLVNGVRAKLQADVAAVMAAGTGMQVQAFDTDLTTTIRRAITKAQNGAAQIGAGPTSILISENDAETVDLEQIAHAAYAPGQAPAQVQSMWRRPIVTSAALPDGFAYVGDLRQVELYTGEAISVTTGWVDQQFIENKLTILAEVEAVAGIFGAGALVKTDLTA
ncbi:MAG: phage major capsid protein [Actinomycetota bacterium]